MSAVSKIQWTDSTWNWSRGCTKVSPGCDNCYAEALANRFGEGWGPGSPRIRLKAFDDPLKWNEKPWTCENCGRFDNKHFDHSCTGKPEDACHTSNVKWHRRRVFSLSRGDWLDPEIPIEWLADALDVIRRCPHLDFLLLTKRPENFKERLYGEHKEGGVFKHFSGLGGAGMPGSDPWKMLEWIGEWSYGEPPTNVWIGCTVEDKARKTRIDELRKIPAVVRFLSIEPQLEDIGELNLEGIHWVIVGGESGPKARPFNIEWARSVVKQCKAAGVACFVKQLGAKPYREFDYTPSDGAIPERAELYLHLTDKKGGDISEWPEDLRVREFPTVANRS